MNIPIVLSAFGTTTRALETYAFIDRMVRDRFQNHEIVWAYSSRMVRDFVKKRKDMELKGPREVLSELAAMGHRWAVVQSLHMICGHEFYRLVQEVQTETIRTSIGLPLLCSHEDYEQVVEIIGDDLPDLTEEAAVVIGHGTDHPIWVSYAAMHHFLKERYGPNVYAGVVEGRPCREEILKSIKQTGVKRVRLIPFMLVAGTHVQEDLMGETDSWKASFAQEGIPVSIETKGLGFNRRVVELFLKHIEAALDVIPTTRKGLTL